MGKYLSRFSMELAELAMRVRSSTVTVICAGSNMTGGGSGSGWVFDRSGHVVTNHHVVAGATSLQIKPSNRPAIGAELVGIDEESDLAVLAARGLERPPLDIRHGYPIFGEICLALGSPLGFQESVSLGLVSGISRQMPTGSGHVIEEVVQTDASINPGNSGGPLVDASGFVIGVNTAVRVDAQNIGFAVPSELVVDVVPELIRYGAVHRATLGISIASEWVNEDGWDRTRVSVRSVQRGDSPLEVGDILESIDGQQVKRRYDVKKALNRTVIGRPTNIVVRRSGRSMALVVFPQAR